MKIKTSILTFVVILFLTGCKNDSSENYKPEYITKYKLTIPEPSDLAMDIDGKALWTVSDSNSTVYKISFDGTVLKSFKIEGLNLEGITQIDNNKLAVILERERTVVIIDTNGAELNRIKIKKDGEPNLGFEGITFNSANKHLYLINEKDPGLLIELDENYNVINEIELNFAEDYSGINYDSEKNGFLIISDESCLYAECDINGKMLNSFSFKFTQIEGVAVDKINKLIYLVSDPLEELYVLKY